MIKTLTLGVRITDETRAALEKAARDDTRTISSLVEKILLDWLKAKGYLK